MTKSLGTYAGAFAFQYKVSFMDDLFNSTVENPIFFYTVFF